MPLEEAVAPNVIDVWAAADVGYGVAVGSDEDWESGPGEEGTQSTCRPGHGLRWFKN